jgi:hypothetical protein
MIAGEGVVGEDVVGMWSVREYRAKAINIRSR